MNAWTIHQGDIKLMHLEALRAADALFLELDDDTDCHGAVKEFHKRFSQYGRPARGCWRTLHEHSWIEFDEDDVVLDIYPIGQVRPLLIVVDRGMLRSLYTETPNGCQCGSFFLHIGEHVEDCPAGQQEPE